MSAVLEENATAAPTRPARIRALGISGRHPLPVHGDLAEELRLVRARGLLKLRDLPLPALRTAAASAEGTAGVPADARAVERLLRTAVERLGPEELGRAAQYLFGLVQGTAGRKPTDLRERAAREFGLSPETFRKDRERRIVARVAEEILLLLTEPPEPADAAGSAAAAAAAGGGQSPELQGLPALRRVVGYSGLPAATTHFTARGAELERVVDALRSAGGAAPAACVVHGMAGVGKTALVVRAAHDLAADYPGGCVFLDLHGWSAGGGPVSPAEALTRVLRRLGVTEGLPAHVEDLAALLAATLEDARVLLVLDNARDVAHLLPLLPAAPHCGVLVTSRDRLTGLDEVPHLRLDVLTPADSVRLFTVVLGPELRAVVEAADPGLLTDIAQRCGHLPLALRIAAARHKSVPADGLTGLRDRLADAHTRLAQLDDGARSVAAALADSLAALPGEARQAFALLGVHPGPDLEVHAAAALLDRSPRDAEQLLGVLVDRHLVDHDLPGRYRWHDLVGDFARERAADSLPAAGRAAAFRRVADYHQVAAVRADEVVTPRRHRPALDVAEPPEHLPAPAGYDAAFGWLRAECENLVAVCVEAGRRGLDTTCWQLAHTLRGYFFITKRWPEWAVTNAAALAATRRAGDRRAEAMCRNQLGLAALEQGRQAEAREHYEVAMSLFRGLGDGHGEHSSLVNLAWVDFAEGRYAEFLEAMHRGYDYYADHGADRNSAITLRGMALGEIALGRPDVAVRQLEESLARFAELDLPFDETVALNNLGEARHAAGDPDAAAAAHERAREAAVACGSAFERARADRHLGDLARERGDRREARKRWLEAYGAYRSLGSPEAALVKDRLTTTAP